RKKMNKMSKKLTRLFSVLLMLAVVFAGSVPAKAASTGYEPTIPAPKIYGYLEPFEVEPGQTIDISLPVRVSDYTIKNPVIKLDLDGTPFSLVGDIKLTRDDMKEATNLTMLSIAKVTYLNFQLKVSENARKGTYEGKENILTADGESAADQNGIGVLFTTTDSFNNYITVRLSQPSKFAIKVVSEKTLPSFSIVETNAPDMVKPEDAFSVGITVKNNGQINAEDVRISLDKINDAGFLPDSFFGDAKVGEIKSGAKASAEFNLRAGMGLTSAVQQVTAVIAYKVDGKDYKEELPVYIQTAGKDDEKQVMIGAVRLMSASMPKVIADGDNFTVNLTYKNTSDENVSDVVVQIDGYDTAGFIPDFFYNKVELGNLKSGKSKNATFKFKAPDEIVSGSKPLTLKVTYTTATGSVLSDTVTIYADVKSKTAASTTSGMPKLLVMDYSTGVEKLMAGSEFDFTFRVKNTHSSAKAENIKVTVSSSADNTFSIIQGSASFLIESLAGGEEKECTIPLRVKGDVATGGYDINIEFDYEYAGLDEKKNVTSLSNKITETLKIPVYSNDRPMVNNIQVGTWEAPKANESTTMSFEFYNMGKSPLYNVTATVEGDFTTNGAMLMIGNVESGTGQTWEMDVTPTMGGTCSGTLIISYEDGNGNPSTYEMPFSADVQDMGGAIIDDGGMIDDGNMGFDDGNMGFEDGMMPEEGAKKGLPLWAWIAIGVGAAAVVAAVVVIVVKVRKKKKGDLDFDEDD
ncbi:MAG: hypothetical protein IKS09_04710, partial [Lachnospiraceae bacterium]|nr:hypothetical protein [Lachnospiraceae bacterium]